MQQRPGKEVDLGRRQQRPGKEAAKAWEGGSKVLGRRQQRPGKEAVLYRGAHDNLILDDQSTRKPTEILLYHITYHQGVIGITYCSLNILQHQGANCTQSNIVFGEPCIW